MTLAASLSRSWVVFVRDSLKVTRTVRNNKLHFTWGCSIFLLKKEKGPEAGFLFFFSMILTFSKYLISNHNTLSYLLFSNVFRGFSILLCRGVWVFFRVFFPFLHSSSRAWLALGGRLALATVWPKTLKNCLFCRFRPPQWN